MFPQLLLDSCERVMSEPLFWHLHIIYWHHPNSGEKDLERKHPQGCLQLSACCISELSHWGPGHLPTVQMLNFRQGPSGTWPWVLLSSGYQPWDLGWTAKGTTTRRVKGNQKCRVLRTQRVWGREEALSEGKSGQDKNEKREMSPIACLQSLLVSAVSTSHCHVLTLHSCVCQSLSTSINLWPCPCLFL